MNKIHCLFILLLLNGFTAISQGWLPMGARSISMANASVTLNDAWAFHHNPGALGEVKNVSIGLAYQNRFLLRELQSQGFVYAQPLKYGVLSIGGQFYGYKQYRTQRIGAGYSLKLAEKFYAGVQLNYQGIQLADYYGNRSTVTAEFGLQAHITEKWKFGASVFNLGRAKLSDFQNDRFSTLIRLGTSYSFSKKVIVAAEAEKDLESKVNFKGGIEYQPVDNFFIRAGAASAPIEFTFGFGYRWKVIQLDIGSAYQQLLGWSPCFSISYIGNKVK